MKSKRELLEELVGQRNVFVVGSERLIVRVGASGTERTNYLIEEVGPDMIRVTGNRWIDIDHISEIEFMS